MRGLLIVLGILVLAGCIGGADDATPTPTPIVTPEPTTTIEPTPESTVTPEPEVASCFEVTDESIINAVAIKDCYMAEKAYLECTHTLLKEARITEEATGQVVGWPVRLYSKALDCAKAAMNEDSEGILPERLDVKILGYYDCYESDGVCWVTAEELDQIVLELEVLI